MPDRKEERVTVKLDRRMFDDANVRELLDEMDVNVLRHRLGEPVIRTIYAKPQGYWKQGDGRPTLADDDPAVMQAIGRCAAARIRGSIPLPGAIHPAECGWCSYPIEELLRACDWATWHSRYVTAELAVWTGDEHSSYVRELRANEYDNPRWAAWFALPQKDRAYQVGTVR